MKEKQQVEVCVGQTWPDLEDVRVVVSTEQGLLPRMRLVLAILTIAAALLVALTAYGMANGDEGILGTVLMLVRDVVIAVLGWAIGRYGPH